MGRGKVKPLAGLQPKCLTPSAALHHTYDRRFRPCDELFVHLCLTLLSPVRLVGQKKSGGGFHCAETWRLLSVISTNKRFGVTIISGQLAGIAENPLHPFTSKPVYLLFFVTNTLPAHSLLWRCTW